jgi:hypothetical protein
MKTCRRKALLSTLETNAQRTYLRRASRASKKESFSDHLRATKGLKREAFGCENFNGEIDQRGGQVLRLFKLCFNDAFTDSEDALC